MTQAEHMQLRRRGPAALIAATVFLVAYLLVGPVGGSLADRDLPLPDDSAADVAAFYATNGTAALVGAVLQIVSVVGLLLFARAIGARGRAALAAGVAVAAMVVSSVLTGVVTVVAGDVADETVALLRQIGFYAGGVAHVVALGIFVLLAVGFLSRCGVVGRVASTVGYVAGSAAVLSVLSVAIYYANALLPLGRVLCMVWAVIAGVAVWRSRRDDTAQVHVARS